LERFFSVEPHDEVAGKNPRLSISLIKTYSQSFRGAAQAANPESR
jgi:hypothetical protein